MGFIGVTVVLLIPFASTLFFQYCRTGNLTAGAFTLRCGNTFSSGSQTSFKPTLPIIIGILCFVLLLSIGFVWVSRKLSSVVVQVVVKRKGVFLLPISILALTGFILTFVLQEALFLYVGLFFLHLLYLLLYERRTYADYSLEEFRKRLPYIIKAWVAYIFKPIPGLGLAQVLAITFSHVDMNRLFPESESHTVGQETITDSEQ